MLVAAKRIKHASVLRRMLFACTYLPEDHPNYWETVLKFRNGGRKVESCKSDEVKLLLENIKELDCTAFATDKDLFQDLSSFQIGGKPLGVVLISENDSCLVCGSKLLLRKDRPAKVVIYDDIEGTLPASHYHKYCKNRSCGFVQYYGYYTKGGSPFVYFYSNWKTLPYFLSSNETAFSMKLMERFDAEIFIGQLSFKQCADLYNYLHLCKTDNESK